MARGAARAIESCVTQAWFAEGDDFRELLQEMRADAGSDAGFALMEADYSEALFELGTGGYQQALKVWPDSWDWDIYTGTFGIADLVESALRSDDRPRAEAVTARYAPRAEASGCPAPLGLLARAQALLAPDDSAEELYLESIRLLETADARANVARTRLVYGEWLRRIGRRRDAREPLRAAFEMFDAMGAVHFRERASVELAATGETARKRTVDSGDQLTPQESHIARLAAIGATNPEIAAQLFISANTVDYHLRKVYRKLGVRSRRELQHRLPPGD